VDLDFLKWTWAFNKSCTSKHVKKSIPVIKDITVWSQELYDEIKKDPAFNFHYEKKGLLMLCQTEEMLEEEVKVAKLANDVGLEASEITLGELKEMEPNVTINIQGAVLFKCDSHTTPNEFMTEMKAYLIAKGVQIVTNEKVENVEVVDGKIKSIQTDKRSLVADEYVMAAGSWTGELGKKLGLKLLMQAGKGYSINTENFTGITIPAILTEAKIAVTPMNGFTRFAGTMEIAGINHDIDKARVEAIANGSKKYYPNVTLSQKEKENATCGLRPVSPDGLPYIGKSEKCTNLTIAAGHAMLGWTMGTATGKLVSQIVGEQRTTLDVNPFHPDRKF
jgi:D-amino-acid dehydrogenase